MIKSLNYYSIIAIFLIICYLPTTIADSSSIERSFIWHAHIISIAFINLINFKRNHLYKSTLIDTINLFWSYLLIYNIIWLLRGATGIVFYIISVSSWVACANLFYKIGSSVESKSYMIKNTDSSELIKRATILIIIIIAAHQFFLFSKIGFIFELEAGYGVGGSNVQLFKNIYPFFLAAMSTGLFLIKKKRFVYVLIILILICILLSNKRGPLVGMAISIFITILFQRQIKEKIKIIFFSTIFLLLVFYIASNFFPELFDTFIRRFTEEEEIGSGRTVVWAEGFHIWNNRVNQIFGGGPGYSSKLMMHTQWGAGLNSHSDYMDILFQYGYLGLLLQLSYCFQIIKTIIKVRREEQFQYKNMLIYSGTFIVVTMVYTMTYMYIVAIISSIFFFYTFGKYRFYKTNKIKLGQIKYSR